MDWQAYWDNTVAWLLGTGIRVGVIVVLTAIALWVVRFVSRRLFAVMFRKANGEMKERADTLRSLVNYGLGFAILAVAAVMVLGEFGIQIRSLLASSVPRVFVIVILTVLALRLARFISRHLFAVTFRKADGEMRKRADTLSSVVNYALIFAILSVAAVMVLDEFGIQIGAILAAAGVVGLAIGFGAQSLVQDVISGFFILLEDQVRVGDVVQIGGKSGLVERVNLRVTVLRDLAGNVHYVRNGHIDTVTNMTKVFSFYVFDIGVAYREDVDEVIEVIKLVDEDLRGDPVLGPDILQPIEILGLDQFAESAVIVKARTKTKPIRQWAIGREFNRRLKKAFDERDIEIPFPHVTLYMGEPKQGGAAAMNVNLKQQNT